MARKFGCLFIIIILLNILHIVRLTTGEVDESNLQQRFTSKCDDLCVPKADQPTEYGAIDAQSVDTMPDVPYHRRYEFDGFYFYQQQPYGRRECLRGCQYFNIEFLTNARTKGKIVDLNQLVERCGASCGEAYKDDKIKKENCFNGCNEMMILQTKAPYINGWLVYMGATDRNMVLLQPDFDMPSKEDWVLLDSMFRANDYEYDPNIEGYEKIFADTQSATNEQRIHTVPIFTERQHFTINYCIPTWMWMIPLLLLLAFVWVHYSNYIYGVFIREGLEREFGINATDTNGMNGVAVVTTNDKKFPQDEDFVVGTDFYFYPSPAIPPPKYNEAAEAILMMDDSSDDEATTAAAIANGGETNTRRESKTKKKKCGNSAEVNI